MRRTVTHVIIGLGKGGAETMLYQILKYSNEPDVKYDVVSLGADHYYEDLIRDCGVNVYELDISRKPIKTVFEVYRILKQSESDCVCCWMYHADLIGFIVGRLAGVSRIIWNIRHSDVGKKTNSRKTLIINKLCALVSGRVDVIAYNGEQAKINHEALGYCKSKSVVLSNGVDFSEYKKVSNAKDVVCRELSIEQHCKIVLSVSRFHPIKDIPTFLQAFSIAAKKVDNVVAIMCGYKVDCNNSELLDQIADVGLTVGKDIYLLGVRNDLPYLFSAADVYVLHSAGEAFPNTLLQAISCECPFVATDVGDVRRIVSGNMNIAKPGDFNEIATMIQHVLSQSKDECNKETKASREYIEERFEIHKVAETYEELYKLW